MEFRCSIWILWTTLACTTAPNIEKSPTPPALSFVLTPTRVYELEDTPALIWRNNDKLPTEEAFYFSYMTFACSELRMRSRLTMENRSTTRSLAFIYEVMEPQMIRNLKTHPQLCKHKKRYHASAVSIIRLNNQYQVIDLKKKGNPKRQEFSIGYEVADDTKKLNEKGLPAMERFEGLAEGSGWLETYKVVYDTENLIARQVSYELNFLGLSETAPGHCDTFDVGSIHEFFKNVSFINAYRRTAQSGIRGTTFGPQSGLVSTVIVSTLPSSSGQSESYRYKLVQEVAQNPKRPRLIMQSEGSQPNNDESDDNNEIKLIDNERSPWNREDYFGVRPTTAFNNSNTILPTSTTESELSKSGKRLEPSRTAFDEPPDEEYMVMQQLAPIEYFDVFSVQWSTCSYLNVVPMWISLANGPWKRVDKAIRKMLYVIDKLSIIAGTHGALKLPKRNDPNQYPNAFLHSNDKKILVPELFYKFVVHKVQLPGVDGASLLYGIIIVMHNNFGSPARKICPNDSDNLCFDYGWDVGSKDDEIAKPYCCKPSPATLELLDITAYSSRLLYLDLNSVVLEITGDGENVVRNYNQFHLKQYPVVAKKERKTKKLNDIYF